MCLFTNCVRLVQFMLQCVYKNDGVNWSLLVVVLIRALITSDSNDRQRHIKDGIASSLCGGDKEGRVLL